jgi:diguanylate cyclase (GGDEF)-like protein
MPFRHLEQLHQLEYWQFAIFTTAASFIFMDSLTAGIALILVQFCVALVTAGVFLAMPSDKTTRYWALSGLLVACGLTIAILNGGAQRPFLVLNGIGMIVAGMICQWHGVQTFYKHKISSWGWGLGIAFYIAYALCLYLEVRPEYRVLLLTFTLIALLSMSLLALRRGKGDAPWTFVRALVQGGVLLEILDYAARLVVQISGQLPVKRTVFDIVTAYLIPLVGTVLFAIGLLLLYFERIVEENRHLATHDELSKLLNRRAIVEAGERELSLSCRLKRELTIAFLDIDLFKHFNDEFGHDAGDEVIVDVARILEQTCRNIDFVGRYGGEEFLIVLPGASRFDAAVIGERLVKAVRQYRFRGAYPVTVSVGMATLPHDDESCTWDGLMLRADAALYEAKDLGRDRYCA